MKSLFPRAFNVTDLDEARRCHGGVLAPQVRFGGQWGEQWTMFFCDPFGNPIEIKGFRSLDALCAA